MQSSLIETSSVDYPPNAGYVELLFEGVQPQYKYTQIGFLTVEGAEYNDDSEIIQKLKYEAWQKGADAVINIKKSDKTRKKGMIFEQPEDETIYNATVFSGVLVKYTDPDFRITHSDPTLPLYSASEEENSKSDFKPAIVIGILTGVICMIAYSVSTD